MTILSLVIVNQQLACVIQTHNLVIASTCTAVLPLAHSVKYHLTSQADGWAKVSLKYLLKYTGRHYW